MRCNLGFCVSVFQRENLIPNTGTESEGKASLAGLDEEVAKTEIQYSLVLPINVEKEKVHSEIIEILKTETASLFMLT